MGLIKDLFWVKTVDAWRQACDPVRPVRPVRPPGNRKIRRRYSGGTFYFHPLTENSSWEDPLRHSSRSPKAETGTCTFWRLQAGVGPREQLKCTRSVQYSYLLCWAPAQVTGFIICRVIHREYLSPTSSPLIHARVVALGDTFFGVI